MSGFHAWPEVGRAYFRGKLAAGKTPMEAMRCLKRRLSDVVYRQMLADTKASPGGQLGATLTSSAGPRFTWARPSAHRRWVVPSGQPG